jgi:hypothetical protein
VRQVVCDRCGDPIYDAPMMGPNDGEMIRVGTALGWLSPDIAWRDYHRGCARDLTVAEVYNHKGAIEL